jgi:hypothetical protein
MLAQPKFSEKKKVIIPGTAVNKEIKLLTAAAASERAQ